VNSATYLKRCESPEQVRSSLRGTGQRDVRRYVAVEVVWQLTRGQQEGTAPLDDTARLLLQVPLATEHDGAEAEVRILDADDNDTDNGSENENKHDNDSDERQPDER
jgi:hypothetical protein